MNVILFQYLCVCLFYLQVNFFRFREIINKSRLIFYSEQLPFRPANKNRNFNL